MHRLDLEERLRRRLESQAVRITANPDAWDRLERRLHRARWRRATVAMAGGAAIAAALAVGAVVVQRQPSGPPVAGPVSTIAPGAPTLGAPLVQGIAPPRRHTANRIDYKITTTNGESFWVSLPPDVGGQGDPVVIPDAPVIVDGDPQTPRQGLTTASPRQVAEEECAQSTGATGAPCEPRALETKTLPSGARLIHWRLGDAGETTTTVQLDSWTLVLVGPKPALSETIANGIDWSTDREGFLRVRSTDPKVRLVRGGATLVLGRGTEADLLHVYVRPGCELSPQAAGAGRSPLERSGVRQGSWCLGRDYEIHVLVPEAASPQLIDSLYEGLRILPA